jgi:hypothetical protein
VNNSLPAIIVAVMLIVFGAGFMTSHVRSWRRQLGYADLDDNDRAFFEKRYRRRMRTSAAIIVLGVLIGVGDVVLPRLKNEPLIFTFYVLGLLVLTGWVMLQGFGDLWSTATYTDAELTRIRTKRQELERQIVEFKHRNLPEREFDGHAEL